MALPTLMPGAALPDTEELLDGLAVQVGSRGDRGATGAGGCKGGGSCLFEGDREALIRVL